jgi:hypothetical protein
VNARHPLAIASHRAMQAEPLTALAGNESLDFNPEKGLPPDADPLIDVQAEMRILWRRALNDLQFGGPTPQLPTYDAGNVVMVPVTVLVGTLMDLHTSIAILCNGLACDRIDTLHCHLREIYVKGYAQDLANCGWRG